MATSRPELIGSILPRTLAEATSPAIEPGEVEEITQLSSEFQQARDDFLKAGETFAGITKQLAELGTELMQAALDMHAAKCRADKAVATVREMAGLIK